ncbi:MAG: hypothetical protein ACTTIC_04210 [Helicobacteraceae bacterium]
MDVTNTVVSLVILSLALWYIYRSLFKKKGCGCAATGEETCNCNVNHSAKSKKQQ